MRSGNPFPSTEEKGRSERWLRAVWFFSLVAGLPCRFFGACPSACDRQNSPIRELHTGGVAIRSNDRKRGKRRLFAPLVGQIPHQLEA